MKKELRQFLCLLFLSCLISSSQFSIASRQLLQTGIVNSSNSQETMNETEIEEGKLSDQEFVILPDSTLNSEDVGKEEPAASSTGLELPEDSDVVDDQVEFIMNTEVNRSIVRLASNRVSILTQVIGVNASQNCDSKDDCKNADRMKQVFIRNCSGNYDKQCCNELRGVAIGNLSDCCWNYLCREIAPFGGEEYLSDCIINRTCSNIPSPPP